MIKRLSYFLIILQDCIKTGFIDVIWIIIQDSVRFEFAHWQDKSFLYLFSNARITKSYIKVPRGTLYHSYAIEEGRIRHSIVMTPSITKIGAMQYACIGHHITDAQLAIVQCDPGFTCTDR